MNVRLYHFSEEPRIERFDPRASQARPQLPPVVWAIDEWHAPMYFFPRDCPRILLWALPGATEADRVRWLGDGDSRMVAHIERAWLDRLRSTALYRYAFDSSGFTDLEDAGMYVSIKAVVPQSIEAVGELTEALRRADVELRVLESLLPLRGVWNTTLHASGIRLRNAVGWGVSG